MAGSVRPRLTAGEGRRFALTLGGAFLAVAILLWWRHRPGAGIFAGSLATLLLTAGAVVPAKLGPVHRAWMGLAHVISRVTTPIFMALVYFTVLAPVGLVMRAFGHNAVRRIPVDGSFWVVRTSKEQRADIERQF